MFQGFYRLTSGVLSQNRSLNVISNNMANATTPGYKSDRLILSDFGNELLYRTGNKDKSNPTVIGDKSMLTGQADTVTDHSGCNISRTGLALDFAVTGRGFFAVQTANGTVYTRNGNFALDTQGYLTLPGVGRVLGQNGPIYLGTDKISADKAGGLYTADGTYMGRLMLVDFADYGALTKQNTGVFTSNAAAVPTDAEILQQYLEDSNADPVEQMSRMIISQRALQSSAQVMKMYDTLISSMTKIAPTS